MFKIERYLSKVSNLIHSRCTFEEWDFTINYFFCINSFIGNNIKKKLFQRKFIRFSHFLHKTTNNDLKPHTMFIICNICYVNFSKSPKYKTLQSIVLLYPKFSYQWKERAPLMNINKPYRWQHVSYSILYIYVFYYTNRVDLYYSTLEWEVWFSFNMGRNKFCLYMGIFVHI